MAKNGARAARVTLGRRGFNSRLFRWHEAARRPLLIRDAATPWQILVAEVMSQQTGIERIGPIWRHFVDRWPEPHDLAEATTRDLLAAWSGLGYNRRALALRRAAREIVTVDGGRVPRTVEELERLPGVGPYTARAVAATAFGVPVAPVDVNVRRVIRRVIGGPLSASELQRWADTLVDRKEPRKWVNAVMDLAATVCKRTAPACRTCPLAALCSSRGDVDDPRPTQRGIAFASTTRWLRGRLVALLVCAPEDTWIQLPDNLGDHDSTAIVRAARSLEREGFIDLRGGSARLRANDQSRTAIDLNA